MTTETIQSKTIQVNGVPVTCYSDGSVELVDKRSGKLVRNFGSESGGSAITRYRMRLVGGKLVSLHRMIAEAFHGLPDEKMHTDHINGDSQDNRPENLRWVTHSENLRGVRKPRGSCKYRGVDFTKNAWRVQVLGKYHGRFKDAKEAAEHFDDVAFYEHDYPIEGLNFPQRILDKMAEDATDKSMTNSPENIERIQTQIDMVRQESRILSYRIDRMKEQRKALSEEKRRLKGELATHSVK